MQARQKLLIISGAFVYNLLMGVSYGDHFSKFDTYPIQGNPKKLKQRYLMRSDCGNVFTYAVSKYSKILTYPTHKDSDGGSLQRVSTGNKSSRKFWTVYL